MKIYFHKEGKLICAKGRIGQFEKDVRIVLDCDDSDLGVHYVNIQNINKDFISTMKSINQKGFITFKK